MNSGIKVLGVSRQGIAKLAQTARAGDSRAMKATASKVGKTGTGCHEGFRAK